MTRALRPLLVALALAVATAVPALAQLPGGSPPPTSTAPTPPPPTTPAPPPPPTPKLVVERPVKKVLVQEGAAGRYMLTGRWYFRQDDAFVGDRQRYFAQRSLRGWTKTTVPSDWNARDTTQNRSSVGWYRYEFRLPKGQGSRRFQWKLRFESVNHRAAVYLNGKLVGVHTPGYLPFEVDLPGLKRGGRNRLVVRVSSLRSGTDLTHWRRAAFNGFGTGGWWNFGGISREVYLRRIDGIDVEQVRALPRLRCVRCDAVVTARVRMRNMTNKRRRATVALFLQAPRGMGNRTIVLGTPTLGPGQVREVSRRFRIHRPRLWQPGRPALYGLRAAAVSKGARRASYGLVFGVRKLSTRNGRLFLNGHRLTLRGVSIHEDDRGTGAALTRHQRHLLVHRVRQLHGTVVRSHYPLHPDFLELFDRAGILFWSDAPVYQVPEQNMASPVVRQEAVRVNRETVLDEGNHPSVFVWSVANELPNEGSAAQSSFIREAARAVRRLDPTRLVGIDRQSQIGQPEPVGAIRGLDVIGVNDYFGWYDSSLIPNRPSTVSDLGPFLDIVHQRYPRQPLVITEFGAESNRSGPDTEKGTYQFQTRWLRDSLAQLPPRPFVAGAIVWILKDFRVTPTWGGGNPKPNPPWNNKGLIDESGAPKPAFFAMRDLWRRTRPLH